jgi:hypothetical protein
MANGPFTHLVLFLVHKLAKDLLKKRIAFYNLTRKKYLQLAPMFVYAAPLFAPYAYTHQGGSCLAAQGIGNH